ncbi:MAG: hypothetical protein GY711_25595 [bacterium]|nr:hypothetical protein [bacterium]
MTALRNTASLLGAALLAGTAAADILYSDFSSTSGLTLLGSAGQAGNRLQLTPASPSQAGAAWFGTRQNVTQPFSTLFRVDMSGGADGMAFLIQRDSLSAIGGSGELLGYHGIVNSVAVELDVWGNPAASDPNGNHVSVHSFGVGPNSVNETVASLGSSILVPTLDDSNEHTVLIQYVPGSLRVFVDDLQRPAIQVDVDLSSLLSLNDGTAWVGFTGATGGVTQTHEVLSWSFTESVTTPTGNNAPDTPTITEPEVDGQLVNGFDVHMESTLFADPDAGDSHACSDWEIWTISPTERVWGADCITGPEAVHSHLGDGVFEGSHAGQNELNPMTAYVLRIRHKDDSGDPWTEWSPWDHRSFVTGALNQIFPLELDELVENPAPRWQFKAGGSPVDLPTGSPQPTLYLETGAGQPLLSIQAQAAPGNLVTFFPGLPDHEPMRLRIEAGGASGGLSMAESDLTVFDHECNRHTILLPALTIPASQADYYWISFEGATWVGNASQTEPDFSNLARGQQLPWVTQQPGFQVEVVASDLQLPVNIAFVPNAGPNPDDPFFYVTELYGTIKVVARDGTVSDYATNLLNYTPSGAFPGSGEQGLTGIAVDPLTGDVFASMLYAGVPSSQHYPKVMHFTSNDGGRTAATQTTILDMNGETQGQSHQISTVTMLPDQTLLVHNGDGFIASNARNLDSYRGKILRLNLDGSAPTDNPFYDAGNGINSRDYVYAYGVRNPFGGSIRAADGSQYCVENGPSIDRFSKIVAGRDYLWDGQNSDMNNFAIYVWNPATGPVNIAWIQPETFGGSGFPQSKMDHAFVTESGPTYAFGPQSRGKRITEFELDAAGNLISGPDILVEYVGAGRATASALTAGPDGLYFADLYRDDGTFPTQRGAKILRVSFGEADDCNANGASDECDIASGASTDLNANGLPDECEAIGSTYCSPAIDNSTGEPAKLLAFGSDVAGGNPLELFAYDVPQNQFGYFLTSQTQGLVVMPGGSEGNLCLGGTIGRYAAPGQVQNSGSAGAFSLDIDTTAMPLSPPVGVAAGETWNFQAWFRDQNPTLTSNFTDGLAITFQ